MNRRRFFSTLVAAGAAAPVLAQPPATPPRIDRLRLDAAESIFGVDFNEAEEQMRARRLLMQEMDKLMSQYDVSLSPAPGSSSLQAAGRWLKPSLPVGG